MSRKFRTFLFIFFVMMFVIATPCLVLYAQGYRLNWPLESGKKLIVMTGGLFVKTQPKQADIYVNGKLEDQTDFFFGSALVENLLPRPYQIEIKKSGYQPWQKTLEIKEKEVTEIRNITLFPEHTAFDAVEKNASGALISADGQKIVLRGQDDNGWNLKLYDISKGVTSKLAGEKDFSAKGAQFNDWSWTDAKTISISVFANNATSSYSIAIDKNPARLSKNPAANASSTPEIASAESNGNAYSLDKDGFIIKKDFTGNTSKASAAQIAIGPNAKYRMQVFNDYYFVSKNSELYVAKPGSDSFEKIFDNLSSTPKLSPDGKKVVYASDSEIWLYFIKDKTDPPQFTAGNKVFIARLSEKISKCDWLNSDYLIFAAGGAIETAETDNRDKINTAGLVKFAALDNAADIQKAQFLWDGQQNSIYLFLGSTLYKSQPID